MKKQTKRRLAFKLMFMFVVLGVLICVCSSVVGYFQYRNSLQGLYNSTAYDIAETDISYISGDELNYYSELAIGYDEGTVSADEIEEAKGTQRYGQIASSLDDLRAAMGANDVFVFCLDLEELNSYAGDRNNWTPLLYIFDSYTVPEYSYVLGDKGSFNPDYIGELSQIGTTGQRVDNYFISDGDYGNNTAAILPVTCSNGNLVMFAVEIPMLTLDSALRSYIIGAVLITVGIVAVIMLIYYFVFNEMFVRPIRRMAQAASDFIYGTGERLTSSISSLTIRSNDEIGQLCQSLKKMETDILEYISNLRTVTAERERISVELNVATQIQASMLPCIFPAFPDRPEFDIFASMTPAKEVGGDFYDFYMVDDTHLAVVMADVSGKGVPAALFMVIGKTLIKDHTAPGRDLGEVFTEVNNLLCESNSENLFITAFEGVLDLKTGELRYVNAGHEMPYICHAGTFEVHKIRPGFVLAGMDGMRYKAGSLTLQPGDKLFQYTDGVTEATNSANELYGMERLAAVLNAHASSTPKQIITAVKDDIDAFAGTAPQFDDITMLCVEYVQKPANLEESKVNELTVAATVDNIPEVTAFVDGQLQKFDCPLKVQTQIDIAIDELFSNIARYAYNPDVGPATVRVEVHEDAVVITFIDNGVPYDPLAREDPDVTLSADERDIGGLGIYMVKKSMDEITYEYKDGQNILRIRKNI